MRNQPRDCGRKTRRDYLKIPRSVAACRANLGRVRAAAKKLNIIGEQSALSLSLSLSLFLSLSLSLSPSLSIRHR